MLRPVNGVLVVEGEQTGDGRYIVPGALTWAELPLPLAWIDDGDQHVDMVGEAPQIGNILTIARVGSELQFTGHIDDEIEEGAELLRRMGAGSAGLGNRQGVSIDPDDWSYDVVDTTEQIITASMQGRGEVLTAVRAAAGDGEPTGVVVWSEASDEYIMRFTRLRIRGVTGCAVAAFDGAWIEITDPAAVPAEPAPVAPPAPAVTASFAAVPPRPPADWFNVPEPAIDDDRMVEQFDADGNPIGFACPLTILDSGQWFGHLAAGWGQCHTGYQTCVNPPPSMTNYAHFHIGETVCDDGQRLATGNFVVSADHPAAHLMAPAARDAYAHSGLAWGRGRVIDGEHAPWGCGALMPGIDEATLAVIRATTLSGDWRRIGSSLELIVGLSVSGPGFPVAREQLAASAVAGVLDMAPTTFFADGVQTALIAAAGAARCKDCGRTMRLNVEAAFDAEIARMVERRTRHMIPEARDAYLRQIRKPVSA